MVSKVKKLYNFVLIGPLPGVYEALNDKTMKGSGLTVGGIFQKESVSVLVKAHMIDRPTTLAPPFPNDVLSIGLIIVGYESFKELEDDVLQQIIQGGWLYEAYLMIVYDKQYDEQRKMECYRRGATVYLSGPFNKQSIDEFFNKVKAEGERIVSDKIARQRARREHLALMEARRRERKSIYPNAPVEPSQNADDVDISELESTGSGNTKSR